VAAARALLAPGAIVDVVAPGSRCADAALERGLAWLRGIGLTPRVPVGLFGADLLSANSDEARFEHLRRAFAARDARAIWCVRGGYGANRLLARFARLASPKVKKLFIGYSDATTLHFLINHRWNWPSLHGPLIDRLGSEDVSLEESAELTAVLTGTQTSIEYEGLIALNAAARRRQVLVSRMFGGNLTMMQTLLGTPWMQRPRQILFLEEIGERGYRIDRTLQHLGSAGALAGVRAIVFGTFTGGNEPDGSNLAVPVLERFAQSLRIPVLRGLAVGHGSHQRPLFFNTRAELTCGPGARLNVERARL